MRVKRTVPPGYWGNLIVKGLCLIAGALIAGKFVAGFDEPFTVDLTPKPVPITVKPASQALAPVTHVTAANVLEAPANAPVLPLLGETPSAPVPSSMGVSSEVKSEAPPSTTKAPKPPKPDKSPTEIPPLPASESPAAVGEPLPPKPIELPVIELDDSKIYPEVPYGDVLVLEILVNDRGTVVDSKILVPSYNAMGDVSLTLAVKGRQYNNLTPPLLPGETRRLELRIPYVPETATTTPEPSLLP